MTLVYYTFTILLAFCLFMFLYWPWIEMKIQAESIGRAPDSLQEYAELIQTQEAILENLKDLELDHQMEKISDTDYQELRKKLLQSASILYKKIDSFESGSKLIRSIHEDLQKIKADKAI